MPSASRNEDLRRIRLCLQSITELIAHGDQRKYSVNHGSESDPCTVLDREINRLILQQLPLPGEGWLSEESRDTGDRLLASRLWIVDPIDGTREFVQGIPEWCVSVALIEDHEAVAGGILNPSTGELFLGSKETGLEIESAVPARQYKRAPEAGCMLVSRREYGQGKWSVGERTDPEIVPVGSIAYRLAHVAAGYADATCTFETRSEWDIAGGVALVLAAGGQVQALDGSAIRFNNPTPRVANFFAFGKHCPQRLRTIPEIGARRNGAILPSSSGDDTCS